MMHIGTCRRLGIVVSENLTWTKLKYLNLNKNMIRKTSQKYLSVDKSAQMDNHNDTQTPEEWTKSVQLPEPEFDWDYLCDESKTADIQQNIENRKGVGNIHKVIGIWKSLQTETQSEQVAHLKKELMQAAADIPNTSSPHSPIGDESCAKLIETVGTETEFPFKPKLAVDLAERMNLLRTKNVALTTGTKTYYFQAELAQLEQALIRYAVDKLRKLEFEFVSVPDILHPAIIEGCGFKTKGERTQVYTLDQQHFGDLCMIGTAELPLAGYFANSILENKDLPKRLCAVSRCYRAETSDIEEEQGIYRVHQFSKVEMFGVTSNNTTEDGNQFLHEFLSIEKEIFSELGLYFRILEMPTQELGAPAYRKFDVEAWMHGKKFWGEISSASNCSDFQSRRLNIKYCTSDGQLKHATTINGTACAVPRLVMAIFEKFQQQDGSVCIPDVLQPYMDGQKILTKSKLMPEMKWIQNLRLK